MGIVIKAKIVAMETWGEIKVAEEMTNLMRTILIDMRE